MSVAAAGRIGPNAIIQTTAALRARVGDARAGRLLARATGRSLSEMPEEMVDEDEVNQFARTLYASLDPQLFHAVLSQAGRRTADYLMANRIPKAAQLLMRVLPGALALRVLLAGITRHTWTFAGSATVRVARTADGTTRLVMQHCPMCRGLRTAEPICHFYAATLEQLMLRLVSARAVVVEASCEATGAESCSFRLSV